MRAWWIGVIWFVGAVAIAVGSAFRDEPTPTSYWFFLGAALFFFGVSLVVTAIEKVDKR